MDLAQNTVDAYGRGPGHVDHKVAAIDSTSRLSNATLQRRITVAPLFYDFLHEEQRKDCNPIGRGRFRAGKAFGVGTQGGPDPAHTKATVHP